MTSHNKAALSVQINYSAGMELEDYVWYLRREILRAFDATDVQVTTRCLPIGREFANIGLSMLINGLSAVSVPAHNGKLLENESLPPPQVIVDTVQLWLIRHVTCDC
ncbi:hypothetical protein BOX15_Mlig027430g1 [Macrostomum lignano]|uniref:Uncharacterized protein n=1 Tax=Macrostomum lignano TaxID=282301 RepID=A0A267E6R5_9PLAT|nr:hypothetical protein BOX15_Mlig027430g1 [Macrostomum lignano]